MHAVAVIQARMGSTRLPGKVLLPLAGPETRVASADLRVDFDAARGEAWDAEIVVRDLDREGFAAERIALEGGGTIAVEPDGPVVTADLDFVAEALDLGSEAAETALGERVTGQAVVAWRAPEAGTYTIDTEGSAFDTVLYLRRGCDPDGTPGEEFFFEDACNDDAAGIMPQSRVEVDLMADQVILIVVDSKPGLPEGGSWQINIQDN